MTITHDISPEKAAGILQYEQERKEIIQRVLAKEKERKEADREKHLRKPKTTRK